jgi:hypothetical protein
MPKVKSISIKARCPGGITISSIEIIRDGIGSIRGNDTMISYNPPKYIPCGIDDYRPVTVKDYDDDISGYKILYAYGTKSNTIYLKYLNQIQSSSPVDMCIYVGFHNTSRMIDYITESAITDECQFYEWVENYKYMDIKRGSDFKRGTGTSNTYLIIRDAHEPVAVTCGVDRYASFGVDGGHRLFSQINDPAMVKSQCNMA